jgi:hypothetical protein
MRAHEIIRAVLDIIDQVDGDNTLSDEPIGYTDDDIDRFKQIAGIMPKDGEMSVLANSPNEKVADITAVTVDAGGGLNGPKHPHDIRVKDPSMYPNQQEM